MTERDDDGSVETIIEPEIVSEASDGPNSEEKLRLNQETARGVTAEDIAADLAAMDENTPEGRAAMHNAYAAWGTKVQEAAKPTPGTILRPDGTPAANDTPEVEGEWSEAAAEIEAERLKRDILDSCKPDEKALVPNPIGGFIEEGGGPEFEDSLVEVATARIVDGKGIVNVSKGDLGIAVPTYAMPTLLESMQTNMRKLAKDVQSDDAAVSEPARKELVRATQLYSALTRFKSDQWSVEVWPGRESKDGPAITRLALTDGKGRHGASITYGQTDQHPVELLVIPPRDRPAPGAPLPPLVDVYAMAGELQARVTVDGTLVPRQAGRELSRGIEPESID